MIEQDTKIVFNKRITPDTFLMGLRSPQITAQAKPGQFVMIRVRPGMDPFLRRPFSICGTQGDELILILYRVVGRGTAIMSETGQGGRLSVLGPLGRGFHLPKAGNRCLLVAGGMGVAPLIFLARTVKPVEASFLAGYASASEIVPMDEVGLAHREIFLTTDDGTSGRKGPVTELLETHLERSNEDTPTVFACGPLPMLKKVAALTVERGIPCQASLESHMACGLGACQGCAVRAPSQEDLTYYHVCRDGPVFWVQSLNWESL